MNLEEVLIAIEATRAHCRQKFIVVGVKHAAERRAASAKLKESSQNIAVYWAC